MDWSQQATVSSIEPRDYPLHHAAFLNDVDWARQILQRGDVDVAKRNVHGDTALHIATMLGHRAMIRLLLDAGSPVKLKNNAGWNSLVEAISYGNRQTITEMLKALRVQARESLAQRKPHLFKMLNDLGDFYLELKWDFHSWIPLLSKMLPSDVCRIYKHGCALRMDTSLVDLNDKSWERGDISFVFNPDNEDDKHFVILDNNARTYQRIKSETKEQDLDEEVDVLMSSDVIDMQMSTKPIVFQRAKAGWIFRHEKTEDICGYNAEFYYMNNLNLVTKKRRDHLSPEDVKKNKSIMQKFTHGHAVSEDELKSPDFPLSTQMLIDVLEVLAPIKHINKLRHFCQARMPPGFPVKLDIPIVPTISAKVTFQQFEWRADLTDRMFRIPRAYSEDDSRFPDF